MSQKEKLLLKLLSGVADANFSLEDLVKILLWFRFSERKQEVAIEYSRLSMLKASSTCNSQKMVKQNHIR